MQKTMICTGCHAGDLEKKQNKTLARFSHSLFIISKGIESQCLSAHFSGCKGQPACTGMCMQGKLFLKYL